MPVATTARDVGRNDPHNDHETRQADLVHLAAWRPDELDRSMIRIKDPPEFHLVDLPERPPSFGTLAKLPLEILHIVLNSLDLQTISRISRVSAFGLSLVQCFPAYREVTQHSPTVIAAFAETHLLATHPISQLRRALWSSQCKCCPEYGPFLFLPTCVRCCWECLKLSPSLRPISLSEVKRYFGLRERHIATLPVLHTIPGTYLFAHKTQHMRVSNRLISATAAKELALVLHGSAERLAEILTRRLKAPESLAKGRFLQAATAMPPCIDPLAGPWQGNVPPDDYFGMACLPFPSLRRSGYVENGLWCKGCLYVFQHYRQLDPADVEKIVPPNCCTDRVLHGLSRRARSKSSLVEHARRCYGVRRLDRERALQ